MTSVEDNIKRMSKEQKIAEIVNFFAGQGIAIDDNRIMALSNTELDAALMRIAGIAELQQQFSNARL
jgi:hypothetical protein